MPKVTVVGKAIHIATLASAIALSISGVDARAAMQTESFQSKFAACVVRFKAPQARLFVVGLKAAPRERRCLGHEWSQVGFRVQTYRYALARVLLQRDYANGLPLSIAEVKLPSVPTAHTSNASDTDAEKRRLEVADCVVRAEPTKSFALVGVEAGEASAQLVVAELADRIGKCYENTQVRYPTGFEMHEAIVTRMYQLAYAARKPNNA